MNLYKLHTKPEELYGWNVPMSFDSKHNSHITMTNGLNDEPAISGEDDKEWFKDGKLHRDNGPAVVDTVTGEGAWFLNGVEYSKTEWEQELL